MITEAQLISEINTQLPTNHANLITAATLRGVLNDMVSATFQPEGQSSITPLTYGAFGDGTEHPITQADIDAHSEWAEIYAIGTSWDTVATQEAIIAAFTTAPPAPANGIHVEITSDTLTDCIYGNPNFLVNGIIGNGVKILGSGNVAGLFFKFFFKAGATIVTECTMFQNTVNAQGTWQWQGSNDGSTWVNIGGTFTLGGATSQIQTSLNGNATPYSFYQLIGISGATVPNTTTIQEFRFMQNGVYDSSNRGTQYSWNSLVPQPLYIPQGNYWINRTLLMVAQNFSVTFAERASAIWAWHGAEHTIAFKTDSAAYGVFRNLSMICNESVDILWDMNGDGLYGGLKTQQLTIENMVIFGFNTATGVAISRAGGSAQGDTITFINPFVLGCFESGVYTNGTNAVSIQFIGGDFQGCTKDAVSVFAGQVYVDKTSFQNQWAGGRSGYPVLNQITTNGADLHIYGNTTGNPSSLRDARSESMVGMRCEGGVRTYVDNSSVFAADIEGWFNGIPFPQGIPISGGTLGKTFISVGNTGTNGFLPMGAASTTSVIDDPSAGYTPGQWVGFPLYIRFASNGFITYETITANTATTITVGTPFSSIPAPGNGGMYAVGGFTGGVAPAFDGLADGFSVINPGTGQGFTTTAGSTTVTFASTIQANIAPNQWVVIPWADFVGPSLPGIRDVRCALFAKVVSVGVGSAVLSRPAQFSITDSPGYFGTVLADNQAIWMGLDYDAYLGCSELHASYIQAGRLRNCGTITQFYSNGRLDYLRQLDTGPSITIDYQNGSIQSLSNVGALTINAPTVVAGRSLNGDCLLQTVNTATAGAISFSGFSVGAATGDALDTVNGHVFTIHIWTIEGVSSYHITAGQ